MEEKNEKKFDKVLSDFNRAIKKFSMDVAGKDNWFEPYIIRNIKTEDELLAPDIYTVLQYLAELEEGILRGGVFKGNAEEIEGEIKYHRELRDILVELQYRFFSRFISSESESF